MNKKVLTLCAGLLLAGGLLSSADAHIAQIQEGQYYTIKVVAGDNAATSFYLDSDDPSWFVNQTTTPNDADGSMYWTAVPVKEATTGIVVGYKLVNAKGVTYTVKDTKGNSYQVFTHVESNGKVEGQWRLKVAGEDLYAYGLSAVSSDACLWGIHNETLIENQGISADALNAILGNGFEMTISHQLDAKGKELKTPAAYTDLKGNVFTGKLTAEQGTKGVTLKNAAGKYIVMTSEKWGTQGAFASVEGNKFDVTAEKANASEFTFNKPVGKDAPVEVAVVDAAGSHELIVIAVDGTYYLTVDKNAIDGKAEYTKDYDEQDTYITLGADNYIDYSVFNGKLWNIYNKDGQIASPDCESKDDFVATAQVAADYPEGQWLYNGEAFTNRESGETLVINGLRKTDKENVYSNADGNTYTFVVAGEPYADKKGLNYGYLSNYNEDLLKQKAFTIGAPIDATSDTIYLANGANGVLKFTTDKADAVQFRLSIAGSDQLVTDYIDAKGKAAKDYVNYASYNVTEAISGKVLAYDTKNERYILSDKEGVGPMVFKNKKADTYNIVLKGESAWCASDKLYAAFNVSELSQSEYLYKVIQNDLFIIADASAQQYRGDFSESALDTIKIFRNVDNSYVTYEQGELLKEGDKTLAGFWGIENFHDAAYAQKNPALLADTAIHANTWRPQYLFAVRNTEATADTVWCNATSAHKHATLADSIACDHTVITAAGQSAYYLVNLVDSAKAFKGKTADNKFIYQNYVGEQPYYRLGFVKASHVGKALVIASTGDTIKFDGADKVCTYALKYVDADRDAFTIETLYDGETRGYVKYHNGLLVVTPKATEAEVFDLEELTGIIPTANEAIAATSVSVSATTGAVVVKGAAGKAVVVSNILGQTLANTVVTSDNASISVPAGIVVVAVEGEDAVKVVVK